MRITSEADAVLTAAYAMNIAVGGKPEADGNVDMALGNVHRSSDNPYRPCFPPPSPTDPAIAKVAWDKWTPRRTGRLEAGVCSFACSIMVVDNLHHEKKNNFSSCCVVKKVIRSMTRCTNGIIRSRLDSRKADHGEAALSRVEICQNKLYIGTARERWWQDNTACSGVTQPYCYARV